MFYLTVILSTLVAVGLLHAPFGDAFSVGALLTSLGNSALGVISVIAIDGIVAFIVRRMPEAWFSHEKKLYAVPKREREFLRKTKIGVWKRFVPELGCFTGFHKSHVADPKDPAYIERFLLESNYGAVGHVLGAFLGFLILLLPFCKPLSVGLPIAIVNFVLSMLPTCILRYNTPSLLRLLARAKREAEKKG
ncbi:MAG: hypothetical protein IKC63_02345 [Clostridia bacterium]|nr:hypothetical protein [Clostridia bacterium]